MTTQPRISRRGAFHDVWSHRAIIVLSLLLLGCTTERIVVGVVPASTRPSDASDAHAGGGSSEAARPAADGGAESTAGHAGCGGECETARVPPSCVPFQEEITADVVGDPADLPPLQYAPIVYFSGGAQVPAGRYRIEYIDGCFTCCVTLLDMFVLVGGDRAVQVAVLPGGATTGLGVASVAQCPVTGEPFAPLDFEFQGGPLGIWLTDTVAADNINGDRFGGRSPTWRLTQLDACHDKRE